MFYLYKWTPQGLKVIAADTSVVSLIMAQRVVGGIIRAGQ